MNVYSACMTASCKAAAPCSNGNSTIECNGSILHVHILLMVGMLELHAERVGVTVPEAEFLLVITGRLCNSKQMFILLAFVIHEEV